MRSVADVRRPQETRGRLAAVTMVYPASTVRVWLEIRALKRL